MADTVVTAKFVADTSSLQAGARKVTGSLQGVQNDVQKSAKGFTMLRGAMGAAFGVAALGAITGAARALTGFATEAVAMAKESQLTVRRLDAIAESMGVLDTVLGGSTQRLTDFAQSLQDQTGVSDETVKSAQAIILTFSEVAKTAGETGSVFDRATTAALDLAAAGFGSVEGNAKSLARALQDPLKGLTMLGRQGVSFTEIEKEKIKTLFESGRALEAQEMILAAVEMQVGGTAAATATSMDKMKASIADVQENLGFGLLPVVEAMASAFQDNVTPALLEFSSNVKENIGPQLARDFEEMIPTILSLAKAFLEIAAEIRSAMQPAIQVILRLLQSLVPAIEILAKVLGAVPAPIMAIVGALLILRTRMMQTLVGGMNTATRSVQLSFMNMRAAATTAAASIRASFMTMATAAKTFMVGLGPVGWALIGLTVAFEVFSSRSAEAEARAMEYKEALDQVTGAATRASTEMTIFNLMQKEIGGLYGIGARSFEDLAVKANLSMSEIATALHGTTEEYDAFILRLQQAAEQGTINWTEYSLLNDALHEERSALEGARIELDNKNRAEAEAAAATAGATSATVAAAIAAGEAIGPTKGLAGAIGGMGDEAGEAADEIDIMRQEYEAWLSVTGQIAAVDRAAESIENLGKASVEFGTDLMGQTPKARDFRAEVISAFEDSAAAAQSLSDDLPTQRAIFTGELIKIVASLRASGVKPADIEAFLGAMDGLPASVADIMRVAAKQIGDTDFKSQVEKAFDKSVKAGAPMTADTMAELAKGASKAAKDQLGLTLEPELASVIKSGTTALRPTAFGNGELTGRSMGSGLSTGVLRSSPTVQAAIRRVIQQAHAAAKDEAESTSPSRLFARTGDDLVTGLTLGVTRSTRGGEAAMSKAARAFIRAFMQAFSPREMGEAESAIAGAIESATQQLRDARAQLKDANKAVTDAEKALAEARKGSDPKAIARAERDLARARKEATAAADAVKLGEWVKSNEKALAALQKIARQYDYIVGRMEGVQAAFGSITSLLATPLGTASDLSQMFQFGTDPRTLARNYMSLANTIREAYAVLTDPKIVGAAAASANTAAMNANLAQLESYVTQIIALENEYAANAEQMRVNEQQYRIDEERLKAALSGSVRAYEDATRELDRVVLERGGFIDKINSGFRSFVNNLSGLTQDSVSVVTEEVRDLGNGVRTIVRSTRQEMQGGAGAIAATLRSRLDEVRAFSSNIQSLMRRGLDATLIRDFIEAGVSGAGDTVAALASATDDELRGINDTQAELLKYAQEFSTGVGDAYYSSAIAAQQAIVRDTKTAVDAAQKALDDAKGEYDRERARLEAEQTRIEGDINTLVTQIESLVTGMMTSLVPATEAAAQASLDAMIAQFQKDFPKVSKELNRLMDALAASMERTVRVNIEPVRTSAATRAGLASVTDIPATLTAGGVAPASTNVTYQITVNAGVGDPREIGRVTVDAITAYERSSGRVFARA